MVTKSFRELSKKDASIAGGKGASLGEMTRAKIPVPPGFVLLANTFENFLKETKMDYEIDSILRSVNHKKIHSIEGASKKIKTLILTETIPAAIEQEIKREFKKLNTHYVAVRSSATVEDGASTAWAGQLETYLNTKEVDLIENVKKCWTSLFTQRAIFYRFENSLEKQKISVAVVIQKMVQSEVSGIAFSVHPVTQDRNQILIEAGFGLGEAIVSGSLTPDRYVVEKKKWKITEKKITTQIKALMLEKSRNRWISVKNGNEQKLTEKQIIELAKLTNKIEKHYEFPCDIEWGYEKGKFYILQSRPITTLTDGAIQSDKKVYEKLFSRDFSLPSVEAWVRGESTNPKGWTKEKQPFLPYIFTKRSDDTVHFYYDLQGVDWVTDLLSKLGHQDKNFLEKIGKTVLEKLIYIRPIYAKERVLNLPELKKFLKELENGYPWFEAMWWFCQMDEGKLVGLMLDKIQKVRALTDILCNASDTVIRKSLAKIYPRLGDLSSVLTTQEINSGKIPSKNKLTKRYKGYFFGNNQLFTDKTSSDIEKVFGITFKVEVVDKNQKILKGDIAQKGIVKGIVRRVMGHRQIKKIKDGEILVSPMTIPDFLPAMKKAAAIVTDEGGVVCHAAITARELKKPCIVGTKYATSLLKDGDFVEVNATEGWVRKIPPPR